VIKANTIKLSAGYVNMITNYITQIHKFMESKAKISLQFISERTLRGDA
jgi:hypothetical protein